MPGLFFYVVFDNQLLTLKWTPSLIGDTSNTLERWGKIDRIEEVDIMHPAPAELIKNDVLYSVWKHEVQEPDGQQLTYKCDLLPIRCVERKRIIIWFYVSICRTLWLCSAFENDVAMTAWNVAFSHLPLFFFFGQTSFLMLKETNAECLETGSPLGHKPNRSSPSDVFALFWMDCHKLWCRQSP